MPTRYYVTPYDPKTWDSDIPPQEPQSDLRVDFRHLIGRLQWKWNGTAELPPSSWQLMFDKKFGVGGSFYGYQNQILAMEVDRGFLEFLLWYRKYTPAKYELYLFREGMWDSLLLTETTTLQDIKHFTGIEY